YYVPTRPLIDCPFVHILSNVRSFFFFHQSATTEIYTLSLHDALPILAGDALVDAFLDFRWQHRIVEQRLGVHADHTVDDELQTRSEEHTSELQSRENLVCRLLLEKKNEKIKYRQ